MMQKHFHCCVVMAGLCFVLCFAGCRNRGWCGNPCNPCGPLAQLGGASTIAPPPTYSVQIPNTPSVQPYYNRDAATAEQNLPTSSSTSPAGNQGQGQPGWRPVGGNEMTLWQGGQPTQLQVQPNPGQQVQGQQLPSYPNQHNRGDDPRGYDLAQSSTPGGNFRGDPTRVPVNDATPVRAPAGNSVSVYSPNQYNFAQTNAPQTYIGTPTFQTPLNQTFVPSVYEYRGQPNFGRPVFTPAVAQTYPGFPVTPTVLAQSTVYADPASNSDQGGWRDGELTASRGSMNR